MRCLPTYCVGFVPVAFKYVVTLLLLVERVVILVFNESIEGDGSIRYRLIVKGAGRLTTESLGLLRGQSPNV